MYFRKNRKNKKNNKGFTLIELIVVIAILAILALIAVPRFSGYVNKANEAADKQLGYVVANAMQILIASEDVEVSDEVTITISNDGEGLKYEYTGTSLSVKDEKNLDDLLNDLIDPESQLSSDTPVTFKIDSTGNVQRSTVKVGEQTP